MYLSIYGNPLYTRKVSFLYTAPMSQVHKSEEEAYYSWFYTQYEPNPVDLTILHDTCAQYDQKMEDTQKVLIAKRDRYLRMNKVYFRKDYEGNEMQTQQHDYIMNLYSRLIQEELFKIRHERDVFLNNWNKNNNQRAKSLWKLYCEEHNLLF